MSVLERTARTGPVAANDLAELGRWTSSAAPCRCGSKPGRPHTRQYIPLAWTIFADDGRAASYGSRAGRGLDLDSFVGSGTTLLEAARREMPAVGFDVNPAVIALARCVCLAAVLPEERTRRLNQAMKVGLAPKATELLNGSIETRAGPRHRH